MTPTVTFENVSADEEETTVYHFQNDDVDKIEVLDSEISDGTIVCETESFSVLVVANEGTVEEDTTTLSDEEELDGEIAGTQATISLPSGYTETDSMTDYSAGTQKNGRDSGASKDGQLVKTAEWTDYSEGKGEINLTYAVPELATPTTAVYACGTCTNHLFSIDAAKRQVLELLEYYDEVTVITVHHNSTKKDFNESQLSQLPTT